MGDLKKVIDRYLPALERAVPLGGSGVVVELDAKLGVCGCDRVGTDSEGRGSLDLELQRRGSGPCVEGILDDLQGRGGVCSGGQFGGVDVDQAGNRGAVVAIDESAGDARVLRVAGGGDAGAGHAGIALAGRVAGFGFGFARKWIPGTVAEMVAKGFLSKVPVMSDSGNMPKRQRSTSSTQLCTQPASVSTRHILILSTHFGKPENMTRLMHGSTKLVQDSLECRPR